MFFSQKYRLFECAGRSPEHISKAFIPEEHISKAFIPEGAVRSIFQKHISTSPPQPHAAPSIYSGSMQGGHREDNFFHDVEECWPSIFCTCLAGICSAMMPSAGCSGRARVGSDATSSRSAVRAHGVMSELAECCERSWSVVSAH